MLSLLVTKAYAQFGGNSSGVTSNNFSLGSFNFLNPFGLTGDATSNFNGLLNTIIGVVLTIAALTAFIFLLIAGFNYITAGGDADKATKARTGLVNALVGVVIILVAYVILRYVGSSLLNQ